MKERLNQIQKLYSAYPKHILYRFILFAIVLFLINDFHHLLTQTLYGYQFILKKGFLTYIVYALMVLFLYGYRKQIVALPAYRVSGKQTLFFLILAAFFFLFPVKTLQISPHYFNLLLLDLSFRLFGSICLFIAFLGTYFAQKFKKEFLIGVLLLIPFRLAPILIDHYWEYSSYIIVYILSYVFPLFRIPHEIEWNRYIVEVENFRVLIGPVCAGFYSFSAFSVLYTAGMFLLSQQVRVSTKKIFFYYLLGGIGIFLLNVFRVMSIILVGAYYSKEFAVGMFHSSIGAILFLLFFMLYIRFVMVRVVEKKKP